MAPFGARVNTIIIRIGPFWGQSKHGACHFEAAKEWSEANERNAPSQATAPETESQPIIEVQCVDSELGSEGQPMGVEDGRGDLPLEETSKFRLDDVMLPLVNTLAERFRTMAPAAAASVYAGYVASAHFKNVVARECSAVKADFASFRTVRCATSLAM